jgi:hypothetical protein
MSVDFNLVTPLSSPEYPGQARLIWGDLAVTFTGIENESFGTLTLFNIAQSFNPESIIAIDPPSVIVFKKGEKDGVETNLNLNVAVTPPVYAGYHRLTWGKEIIVSGTVGKGTEFGYLFIDNVAQGIAPVGIDNPWVFNTPIISYKTPNAYIPDTPGQVINFNMIQSVYESGDVDFVFDGFISLGMGSTSDGEFGNFTINNFLSYLYIGSAFEEGFGNPTLIRLLGQIFPQGFDATEWGVPTLLKTRQIISFTGLYDGAFGSLSISRVVKEFTVTGISDGVAPSFRSIQNEAGGSNNFMMLLF